MVSVVLNFYKILVVYKIGIYPSFCTFFVLIIFFAIKLDYILFNILNYLKIVYFYKGYSHNLWFELYFFNNEKKIFLEDDNIFIGFIFRK